MELLFAYYYDRAMKRERVYHDHSDLLQVSDENLLSLYRFPRHEIIRIIAELDPNLHRATDRSHALSTSTQVLLTLRFYASGTFQAVLADTLGLSQSCVSRVISNVTDILADKARVEIRMPHGPAAINATIQDFALIKEFPRVIGAIDATHIPIKAPSEDEHIYLNRKHFHSLNVQIICDAKQLILNYCCKYPGSTEDAFIWSNSSVQERFAVGEFGHAALLLGDSEYPLEAYLMTPVENPETPAEELYNERHHGTRIVVEQCFVALKARFRCLHKSGGALQYSPLKCAKITIACLLLHNYCVKLKIPVPDDSELEEPMVPDEQPQAAVGKGTETRIGLIKRFSV